MTRRSRPSVVLRIPHDLLHIQLDDLPTFGVPDPKCVALRALMADLPLVPDASLSAQIIGPRAVTLPCLAVLARHVGQGLRDANLAIAHDRARLGRERNKLLFLDEGSVLSAAEDRLTRECALFVVDATVASVSTLRQREAAGLVSFVGVPQPLAAIAHWRAL